MELFDLQTSIALIKSMKPYQKVAFFESSEGKDFVNTLYSLASDEETRKSVESLHKALGGGELEKGISLPDVMGYEPKELAMPVDRTKEMHTYPDKRLNSDHVLRAIGSRVLDPQIHWTKESDLAFQFKASPESIEAALLAHVGEGRVAFEKLSDQMIFARI